MSRRYVRRLSGMERYSLVINRAYRYHVDAVVEGEGWIDPADLQIAIGIAAEANPGMRVRLRGWLGLCRWVDSGEPPALRVLEDVDWDARSEKGAYFLDQRLDPARGEAAADVLLLRCLDGLTRVVFRGCHAAFDGRGMLHWLLDVFRALRGEKTLGSDSRMIDMEIQDAWQEHITDTVTAGSPCIPVIPPSDEPGELAYVWRKVEINQNVSQILARAAVFLAAWARRQGEGDVGFTVPVDYRGLRTDEMGVGNLTGYLRLTIGKDDTARNVMQQLNNRLRGFADCRRIPGMHVLLWVPLALLLKKLCDQLDAVLYTINPHLPSGGLVSMGQLRGEFFSCDGFCARQAFGIPGAVGKLNVVFVNYPGFTTVTFAAPAAYNHAGQLDELANAFRDHFNTSVRERAREHAA